VYVVFSDTTYIRNDQKVKLTYGVIGEGEHGGCRNYLITYDSWYMFEKFKVQGCMLQVLGFKMNLFQ